MNLSELQKRAYKTAVAKGWHESDELDANGKPTARQKLAWLALVMNELDKASLEGNELEYADEKSKPCGVISEYADAVIRILDMFGAIGCDTSAFLIPKEKGTVRQARSTYVDAVRGGFAWQNAQLAVLMFAIIDQLLAIHAVGINELHRVILAKMAYNETRSARNGGKLA
jgi:hypothetical protein